MINIENDLSDSESVASLVVGLKTDFNLNFNNIDKANLISGFFSN